MTDKLVVIDHSVSKEQFELCYDETLELYRTSPQPSLDSLDKYYESEDYISHTDTKRNIFEKVYHTVRMYQLNKKVQLIHRFEKNKGKLLDIGCGTGDFLKMAQHFKWDVLGIEPNDQAREIAKEKGATTLSCLEDLDEGYDQSFNVITLWHVLEHVSNLDEYLKRIERLLVPGGTLIIAVPNYKSYDAQYYNSFWAAYDVPRHLWHFSQKSIKLLGQRFGFSLIHTAPMKFDAYYVSLLSEKYKTGKMNIFKGFYIGWRSNIKAITSGEYSSLIYVLKK